MLRFVYRRSKETKGGMYEEEGSEGLSVKGWYVEGFRISRLFFWRRPDLMVGLVWYVGEGRILRLLCRRRCHSRVDPWEEAGYHY